jgi:hypothetical protein
MNVYVLQITYALDEDASREQEFEEWDRSRPEVFATAEGAMERARAILGPSGEWRGVLDHSKAPSGEWECESKSLARNGAFFYNGDWLATVAIYEEPVQERRRSAAA